MADTVPGSEHKLPAPDLENKPSGLSLPQTIAQRRSHRSFTPRELTPAQLALLLWSAQGLVGRTRHAVPSAGATYPLDILAVINQPGVSGFEPGLYHYLPGANTLQLMRSGKVICDVVDACYNQSFLAAAPVTLIVTCELARIAPRYGDRSHRYIYMEAGHVGQNVHLIAESLGLGTVMVGAFDDAALAKVLGLPNGQEAVYLFPIGTPA